MTMFRLRFLKKKSLQRKAWFMGSFLCREIDEQVYTNVRHRLERCGGVETRVKLSAKGWVAGGGHNMPSQFYGLDMINAVQPDTVFVNVLLCVFRRADDDADFPFETVAYKFDNSSGPHEFHQLFKSLCPPPASRNGGPKLIKKQSTVLPARGTAGRAAGKKGGNMPGRPTHGVMGTTLAPERWAAKDRATPRLFASRSLEDLLEENTSTLRSRHRRLSLDEDDNIDLPYNDSQTSDCSTPSLQPVITPADVVLERLNGALDGAWWSEDDEAIAATRTKDARVGAAFPDATDHLKRQRQEGLEFWIDGNDVACQAYVVPAPTKTTAVQYFDDDDYDDDADEFKWVFSSDDEDEQPALDPSVGNALAQVNHQRRTSRANSRRFETDNTAGVRAAMAAPSDRLKYRYSRRMDPQQNPLVIRKPVSSKPSSRRHRVPSLHVMSSRHSRDVTAASASPSRFRRVRSETSLGLAARAGRGETAATTGAAVGAARAPARSRPVSVRAIAGRQRRVQSMSEYRSSQYHYASSQ